MGKTNLITLHDDELTAEVLLTQMEQQLAARRTALGEVDIEFPQYGTAAVCPEMPPDLPFSMNLYHHLRLANKTYHRAETEPLLAESPAMRVPILGSMWKQIRQQAHQLVLFYVNRFVNQQTEVNGHMVHTLNELTLLVERQQRQIQRLEEKLKQLRP